MDRADVRSWWSSLSVRDKESLRIPRQRLLARFVESEDAGEYDADLYEWIVAHDAAFFAPRAVHICTHPEARGAVERGRLSAAFVCPLRSARCPMRRMLDASNRDIRFVRAEDR
jgi:hypothetical protein